MESDKNKQTKKEKIVWNQTLHVFCINKQNLGSINVIEKLNNDLKQIKS